MFASGTPVSFWGSRVSGSAPLPRLMTVSARAAVPARSRPARASEASFNPADLNVIVGLLLIRYLVIAAVLHASASPRFFRRGFWAGYWLITGIHSMVLWVRRPAGKRGRRTVKLFFMLLAAA